jgi:hypothetical protein
MTFWIRQNYGHNKTTGVVGVEEINRLEFVRAVKLFFMLL